MLSHKTSSAILAVSDIARARAFYGTTLGLSAVEDGDDVVVYRTGPTRLVVYRSDGRELTEPMRWCSTQPARSRPSSRLWFRRALPSSAMRWKAPPNATVSTIQTA